VRIWSGNVQGTEDGNTGLAEILPIYTPEREAETSPTSQAFEGGSESYDMHWDTHNAAFSYSQPRFDVRSKLGQITTPTLIVVGRHDPICPVEEAKEIHAGITNSKMVVFEKSGHNPPAEEPEAFQEAALSFLSRLPLD
jgi:proline iminopeptidase